VLGVCSIQSGKTAAAYIARTARIKLANICKKIMNECTVTKKASLLIKA